MPGVKTPFRIRLTDGRELEGTTLPIDLVIAERHLSGLGERKQLQGAFYAAMNALKRQGEEFDNFERFIELIDDYEENPEPGNPNGAAPTGDTVSPPSPTEPESRPES